MIEQFKDYLEVEAAEYRSFVNELKQEFFHTEQEVLSDRKAFYVISNDNNVLICGNLYIEKTDEIHYYIVNMPENNTRKASRLTRQIVLETEEEVKAFFDAINKANHKEERK